MTFVLEQHLRQQLRQHGAPFCLLPSVAPFQRNRNKNRVTIFERFDYND